MSVVLGLDAKLLRGTAGSTGTTEMTNVTDVTLNLSSAEADVTTRGANGWRLSLATLKEASVEWTMIYDTEDADYVAIAEAFFGNTPISLFVTDGDGTGLDADFSITGFNIEQPLEEAMKVSISAKPTLSTRAPAWIDGTDS